MFKDEDLKKLSKYLENASLLVFFSGLIIGLFIQINQYTINLFVLVWVDLIMLSGIVTGISKESKSKVILWCIALILFNVAFI